MHETSSGYSGKTIAVLGLSYCGSTALNYVLDTHPEIYGGSELSRLFSGQPDPNCAICGRDCAYWTPEKLAALRAAGPAELYRNLAAMFDATVICDSSKQISHFLNVMEADRQTEFLFVMLTKHPIRHVASFVTNDLFKKEKIFTEEEVRDAQHRRHDEIMAFAGQTLAKMHDFHILLDRRAATLRRRGKLIFVTYESLVSEMPKVLQPMLEFAGLEYRPEMADYSRFDHHPIGGNMGPHVQTWDRRGVQGSWGQVASYRDRFYRRARNLVMDNKYQQTFSEEQLELLATSTRVSELCATLGYAPAP